MMTPTDKADLSEMIAAHQPGFGLADRFYAGEMIYRADLERIWRRGWVFAGHTCELGNPGDYFTLDVGNDSIIVVRGEDGEIHALHNICRHRGSILCDAPVGRARRFVCPYHQWTYEHDGRLASCRGMHDGVDADEYSLHKVEAEVVAGLIFICLAPDPPNFEPMAEAFAAVAGSQGLERAKVAKVVDYDVGANWKIVWENNRECYHCNVNHPQYIKANFDHYNEDDTTDRIRDELEDAARRSERKWADRGLAATHKTSGVAVFPDADRDLWYAANRTVLVDGYVSETMDGRQVAPLMGDYTDSDVGTVRMRTMPNFWNHSSCDHSVSTRLLPAGPLQTRIRVTWLVDEDAVEGRDYRVEELLPFWQLTSEQDWELCERVQRGGASSRYQPGPLSTHKEYNVDGFIRWYLKKLGQ